MAEYDINFIGHFCFDETTQADGSCSCTSGGAALYGAIAAARLGKRVMAELKLAENDHDAMAPLEQAGVDVLTIPADESTRVEVSHPSGNVDDRKIITTHFAGLFTPEEVQCPPAAHVHLAGCNDHEFTLDFVRAICPKSKNLSADMQSFVRYNDPDTKEMTFRDDPEKREIIALLDKVKLDILEARLLCGTDDLDKAAGIVQDWGCPEVMITCVEGVMVRCGEESHFAKFTNTSFRGRTGRGDTTFGAYLGSRVDHTPAEALQYAAALASLKMEQPGPFAGTLADVQAAMNRA